jgi:Ca-activated chloride channel family protein
MVVLDVSRSMSARDLHPSRLERARLELHDLIQRVQDARLGLTVFAAKPHLLSPLTEDKALFAHYLSSVRASLLPTRGTNLPSALQFAADNLQDEERNSPKTILLISDGDTPYQHAESLRETLAQLKQRRITVYTLVTGSTQGSPLLTDNANWLRVNGQEVITRAQPQRLQEIAYLTNGKSSGVTNNNDDWHHLYDQGIAQHAARPVDKNIQDKLTIWHEYYSWCLLTGLILFLLANCKLPLFTPARLHPVITLCFVVILLAPSISHADADKAYQQAHQAYQQQQYNEALRLFSHLPGYAARMGEGSAAYQAGDYNLAAGSFIQAILQAQTDAQRVPALFNLANCYYQLAQYAQAADVYRDVLRYQPNMSRAQINFEYATELAKQQTKKNQNMTTRRGSNGPAIANLEADVEDNEQGKLTLGDDENTAEDGTSLPQADNYPQKQMPLLSATGVVSQDVIKSDDKQWTYQVNSVEEIASLTETTSPSGSVFWQRLFEWEEGFAAPLAAPQPVTGIEPW